MATRPRRSRNPKLQGVEIPNTGAQTNGHGSAGHQHAPVRRRGRRDARPSRVGQEDRRRRRGDPVAGPTTGFPVTYTKAGRQYIAVRCGLATPWKSWRSRFPLQRHRPAVDGSDPGPAMKGVMSTRSSQRLQPQPDSPRSRPVCSRPNGSKNSEEVFLNRCSSCHGTERAPVAPRTRRGWEGVLAEMANIGAQLETGEQEAVLAFLTERHGLVSVNTANAEELVGLGLSKKDADTIGSYRTEHGPFADYAAFERARTRRRSPECRPGGEWHFVTEEPALHGGRGLAAVRV